MGHKYVITLTQGAFYQVNHPTLLIEMLQHKVFWQRGWIYMHISHCCCSISPFPPPVCSSDGVVITPAFFVQISSFLPLPLNSGRESFPFTGGTGLWGVLLIWKKPKPQKLSLFLKLNSPETIKPWELKKKAERIKRTAGSRCSCVDQIPLKQFYQGEDELWESVGARLKFGTEEIWGPDTKPLL